MRCAGLDCTENCQPLSSLNALVPISVAIELKPDVGTFVATLTWIVSFAHVTEMLAP
jgi:hypothetical protein